MLRLVQQQFTFTARSVTIAQAALREIGSGFPSSVQRTAHAVASRLAVLTSLRKLALTTEAAAAFVINDYGSLLGTLLAFDDQVSLSSSDPRLASTARALGTISRAENEDSVQRAIVMYALVSKSLSTILLSQLNASLANQQADINGFDLFATTSQDALLASAMAESLEDRVNSDLADVISHAGDVSQVPLVPQEWYGDMTNAISHVHAVEESLAGQAVARAQTLHQRAITAAIAVGGLILLILMLPLLFMILGGRSVAWPRRRLRAGALGIAG